ncbi:hypothetical protein M4D55_10480 [Metabacillus idriensis]|uniref:hypothetical protein n=1 Tax=Metabacillus idriensis TaxID=324768 RepID=UPI0020414924|nr:hypothetical protein [Metabacillus idriensis]MCM3596200.1 hypothetical protein [Metabacillus idriensis]
MLKNICKCKFTNSFKLEADYGADPIWCTICGWNLDIDEFPLKDNFKNDLFQWIEQYKKISTNEHNAIGQNLTEKLKEKLGSEYRIIFIPDK